MNSCIRRLMLLLVSASMLAACGGESDSRPQSAASPTSADATSTVTATFQPIASPTASVPAPTNEASPPPQPPTRIAEVAPTPTTPLATSGNAEIYVINVDGTGERNLTNATTAESMPVWSPDGSRIGFRKSKSLGVGGGVYSMLSDGADIQELLPETQYGYHELAWLPDNRIAFMTCDSLGDCGVFTADPGDVNRARLPAPDGGYEQIGWSPDGTRIGYINSNGENREMYVMTVADGTIRQLTDSVGDEWKPNWSPDGRSIAYSHWHDESAGSDIFVIDADEPGTQPRLVYSGADAAYEPAWSPDGSQIVFALGSFRDMDLWIVNADGSDPRQLTSAPYDDNDPVWSPDGSTIAFVSTRDGGQPIDCSYSVSASMAEPVSMDALAWDTHAIVVGTITEALPPAFGDPLNPEIERAPVIYTDYLMHVQRQFRGQPLDGTLRLRQAGGTIGDCSQTYDPSLELTVGDRLLLFLYPAYPDSALPEAFQPTIQGVWAVATGDTIESPSYAYNPVGYDGMTLDEVHALISESLSGEPPDDAHNPVSLDEAPLTDSD